jgi:hypothetical protein
VVDECIGRNYCHTTDKQHIGPLLSAFSDVTVAEVAKLLSQLPNKSSVRELIMAVMLSVSLPLLSVTICQLTFNRHLLLLLSADILKHSIF